MGPPDCRLKFPPGRRILIPMDRKGSKAVRIPRVLSVAGSDSGGGAGIQADLKTFEAFGVYGMTAITAVTAQNTLGVGAVQVMDPAVVEEQMVRVVEDIGVDAVKTGMLATAPIVERVADVIRRYRLPHLVVDPVMRAKGGDALLEEAAQQVLIRNLLPLAEVVTPNLPEAERLVGFDIRDLEDQVRAARILATMGPRCVVVKGGHGEGEEVVDVVWIGGEIRMFRYPRIPTPHTHGTGCTFASAIAAGLARGWEVWTAVQRARAYLQEAIRHALPIGGGHGPLNHHYFHRDPPEIAGKTGGIPSGWTEAEPWKRDKPRC